MNLDRYELITLTAQHARNLRVQVGPSLEASITTAASKTVMINALHAAELDLLLALSVLTQNDTPLGPVCGIWTVQDLIGHLADWDAYFNNWLADLTGNPTRDLHWDEDGDRFNAWLNQQRRGNLWDQDWRDFRRNRCELVNNLKAISDDEFLQKISDRRLAPYLTVYHCAWSALEHYLDQCDRLASSIKYAGSG